METTRPALRGGAPWRLAPVLALLGLLGACAQQVGDIDRTQAGLLKKSVLTGDWLMRRTVIDVPYDSGYTFIGEQDEAVRVRFDIQREHLTPTA